jgi:phosphoketolase
MGDMDKPEHIRILERWMKSYRPEELFDANGRLSLELAELAPKGHRRMSDNPHANGGLLLRELKMADFRANAVDPVKPGATSVEATHLMGKFLRDVMKLNLESKIFASSARTRTIPTAGRMCWRSPIVVMWRRSSLRTITLRRTVAFWRCCPNISARACLRVIY